MPAIKPTTSRAKLAIESSGLTLDDVARAIGRAPSYVTKVINGTIASPAASQKLANFFGFPIHGMKPAPHLSAIVLPEGTKISGLAPDYASSVAKFFGDCAVSGAGEITLAQQRRILFSRPRPRIGAKTSNS